MSKPTKSQSQKRYEESIGSLFSSEGTVQPSFIFIKSSTDTGVIRNGGRNGARFAPRSLLATFKRLAQTSSFKECLFLEAEVSLSHEEESNFHQAQKLEAMRIKKLIDRYPKAQVCHIGGGHDHIFPLLTAVSDHYKKIIVINVDAHADTRTDESFHSGTPFRQFSNDYSGSFHLFQVGLNSFANSFSTLEPLQKSEHAILWKRDLSAANLESMFSSIKKLIEPLTLVLFSLDADAVMASEMPGVSAVNAEGLSLADLHDLWKRYQKLEFFHPPILGIYELNPLYDTVASLSMRSMSAFLYETLHTFNATR